MKKDIHPKWHDDAVIKYNGEPIMNVGSTVAEMDVEIWAQEHPFYTGKSVVVDTAGRVERFTKLQAKQAQIAPKRKGKKVKKETQAKNRDEKETEQQ